MATWIFSIFLRSYIKPMRRLTINITLIVLLFIIAPDKALCCERTEPVKFTSVSCWEVSQSNLVHGHNQINPIREVSLGAWVDACVLLSSIRMMDLHTQPNKAARDAYSNMSNYPFAISWYVKTLDDVIKAHFYSGPWLDVPSALPESVDLLIDGFGKVFENNSKNDFAFDIPFSLSEPTELIVISALVRLYRGDPFEEFPNVMYSLSNPAVCAVMESAMSFESDGALNWLVAYMNCDYECIIDEFSITVTNEHAIGSKARRILYSVMNNADPAQIDQLAIMIYNAQLDSDSFDMLCAELGRQEKNNGALALHDALLLLAH